MKDEANRSGNKFCMVVLLPRPTRALEGHELGVAPTRSKEGTPGAGLQERIFNILGKRELQYLSTRLAH